MITEQETNFLYLADSLPAKFPDFSHSLELALSAQNIPFAYLPDTKDIWARDYMPVQVQRDKFVLFAYNTDYLQSSKWRRTITNVDDITKTTGYTPKKSSILLDGENGVKGKNKAIICDKVFQENRQLSEKTLIRKLEALLEVDQLIFVPRQRKDIIGHADGMFRFVDDHTVLVNDYSKEDQSFQQAIRFMMHNARLDWNPL